MEREQTVAATCGFGCSCEGPTCVLPVLPNGQHCPDKATEPNGCASAGGVCTKPPHKGMHTCSHHGHSFGPPA